MTYTSMYILHIHVYIYLIDPILWVPDAKVRGRGYNPPPLPPAPTFVSLHPSPIFRASWKDTQAGRHI